MPRAIEIRQELAAVRGWGVNLRRQAGVRSVGPRSNERLDF